MDNAHGIIAIYENFSQKQVKKEFWSFILDGNVILK
jgi:hypothetical protein